jgi:hypothetical protein
LCTIGAEGGNRKFDFYLDSSMLISKKNTAMWNQNQLPDTEYIVPNTMIIGKNIIRVKFQGFSRSQRWPEKMTIVNS